MLKARNIGAYRDLLVLFTRYGLKDFQLSFEPEDIVLADEGIGDIEPDVKQRAESFANALKKMGPTYVKFGQVL
jgi:predicted unusual protein kinase regulating ubiquinone biosynthesis (AarF/ABC1/UbiB family)